MVVAGKRIAVVGASAGIGRSFAVQAIKAGADVVLGARRGDALRAAIEEAGGGVGATLDVCDATSRHEFVAALSAQLGSVDLLLCSVGTAELRLLSDVQDEDWDRTIATNVIGLARLISDALLLLAPGGIVAVLSSETAHRARRGLVPYAASKAALEATLRGFRVEHPGTRISCAIVGATYPTEFGDQFDGGLLGPAMEDWQRHGFLQQEFMAPDDVAACLLDVYGSALRFPGVSIDELVIRSPSPVVGTPSA